ncbi:peptide chain release factor N(5)-glutamine methyltransferase [Myroides sp. LJL119]
MLLKALEQQFIQALTPLYDQKEAQSLFLIALQEIETKTRLDYVMNPALETNSVTLWMQTLEKLLNAVPIQYVFQRAYFYGLTFKVTPDTLIPRSETEELVEWILNSIEDKSTSIHILDIGTGSGCIGITLAKFLPNAKVTLMDISPGALQVAKHNMELNQVKVNLVNTDVLALDKLEQKFDIIVSNPPYVRELEKSEIHDNVLKYEPSLALFVRDDDPLIFYRKIARLANDNLGSNGMLFYEINQYLPQQTKALFDTLDFKEVQLSKDLKKNYRMLKAVKR